MNFLATADWHIGESYHILGEAYLERQEKMLSEIHRLLFKFDCKVLVVSGDIFHKPKESLPQREKDIVLAMITKVLRKSDKHVIILNGNHDKLDTSYTSIHYLKIIEKDYPNLHVVEIKPKVIIIDRIAFACVPPDCIFNDTVKDLYESTDKQKFDKFIVLGHACVTGSRIDSGRTMDGLIIEKFSFVDLFIFGDIHMQQQLFENGWMCGAPMQHNWGDDFKSKGVLVFDSENLLNPRSYTVKGIKKFIKIKEGDYVPDPEKYHSQLITSGKIENLSDGILDVVHVFSEEEMSNLQVDVLDGLTEFLSEKGFSVDEQTTAVKIINKMLNNIITDTNAE